MADDGQFQMVKFDKPESLCFHTASCLQVYLPASAWRNPARGLRHWAHSTDLPCSPPPLLLGVCGLPVFFPPSLAALSHHSCGVGSGHCGWTVSLHFWAEPSPRCWQSLIFPCWKLQGSAEFSVQHIHKKELLNWRIRDFWRPGSAAQYLRFPSTVNTSGRSYPSSVF